MQTEMVAQGILCGSGQGSTCRSNGACRACELLVKRTLWGPACMLRLFLRARFSGHPTTTGRPQAYQRPAGAMHDLWALGSGALDLRQVPRCPSFPIILRFSFRYTNTASEVIRIPVAPHTRNNSAFRPTMPTLERPQ